MKGCFLFQLLYTGTCETVLYGLQMNEYAPGKVLKPLGNGFKSLDMIILNPIDNVPTSCNSWIKNKKVKGFV